MASDPTTAPVNGNYAPHHGYGALDQHHTYAYNTSSTPSNAAAAAQPPPASSTPSAAQQADISKDEVGWYFVEQYYTTLSRNPDRLHLFYNKRSQFVSGQEADKVAVCLGQKAISERIKALDFEDCKVRVTNVDSQASDANIVIQVIGEISNKSQPHRKFAQTFVLATQTNGYFVLNDIFRYLIDEEDEPEPEPEPVADADPSSDQVQQARADKSGYIEPVPTVTEAEPKTLTSSLDPAAIEHDAQQVDKGLEDKVLKETPSQGAEDALAVNGDANTESEAAHAEDAPAAAVEEPEEVSAEEPAAVEEPKETVAQPTEAPSKEPASQPAPIPKPAAPKTWASLAASANRVATPATPSTASSNTSQARPTPSNGKTTTPTSSGPTATPSTAPSSAPTAPAAHRGDDEPAETSQDEWTAVGGTHNRQQSRQTNTQFEPQLWRGYIKNVYENVDEKELKAALSKHGEVAYCDISRQKNCAFVDFPTAEAYNAVVNANPHVVNGESLNVEERHRPRAGQAPYNQRGQFQGNRGGRGGSNQGAPRGNYQNNRGGYPPRGNNRGGAPASRGRGGATQAA